MHLDHLSFAVGSKNLKETAAELAELFGAPLLTGGPHPRFGTMNMILPLKDGQYLELVEALDHPASDKAPFGQAVRERTASGGGWLGWCVSVTDIEPVEAKIGRHAVPGNRHRPDGFNLTWRQIDVNGTKADPQLPFVICWDIPAEEHPSRMADTGIKLVSLDIAGNPERISDWLGEKAIIALDDVTVNWVAPHGTPGIMAAVFETPNGEVRL